MYVKPATYIVCDRCGATNKIDELEKRKGGFHGVDVRVKKPNGDYDKINVHFCPECRQAALDYFDKICEMTYELLGKTPEEIFETYEMESDKL